MFLYCTIFWTIPGIFFLILGRLRFWVRTSDTTKKTNWDRNKRWTYWLCFEGYWNTLLTIYIGYHFLWFIKINHDGGYIILKTYCNTFDTDPNSGTALQTSFLLCLHNQNDLKISPILQSATWRSVAKLSFPKIVLNAVKPIKYDAVDKRARFEKIRYLEDKGQVVFAFGWNLLYYCYLAMQYKRFYLID